MEINETDGRTKSKLLTEKVSRRLLLANGLAVAGTMFVGIANAKGNALLALASGVAPLDVSALQAKIKGKAVVSTVSNFRKIATEGLWNELRPERLPQLIVQVQDEQDVVEAIKFAKANKMKVVVRGGGHNWCSPSLRNGGMLIDLTNLNQVISIDVAGKKAVVQPIISNREIQQQLNPLGLAFPSGHCPQVKISGYLLGGGMSWNQGTWGAGCTNVEGVELVTADGERILATATENPDYFWAARGAGSGFFGAVLRYHLKLYALPKAITASIFHYPVDQAGDVAEWLGNNAKTFSPKIELSCFVLAAPPELAEQAKKDNGMVAMVTATAFADTPEEAKAALKPFEAYPGIATALSKTIAAPTTFPQLFDASGALWPEHLRNRVQAVYSDASPRALFGILSAEYKKSPSPLSVSLFAIFCGPDVPVKLPDAAFSMSAKMYGGPWTMWKDAKDDQANTIFHDSLVAKIKPLTVGNYVGESDTVRDAGHGKDCFTEAKWKRLAELRAKYDPDGLFFAFGEGFA